MHAVANGEREAFSTAGSNGTHGESESDPPPSETPPPETDATCNGKKAAYNRPCPKSKKLRDEVCEQPKDCKPTADTEDKLPAAEVIEEEDVIEDNVKEQDVVENNMEDQDIIEDNVEEEDIIEDNVEEEEDVVKDNVVEENVVGVEEHDIVGDNEQEAEDPVEVHEEEDDEGHASEVAKDHSNELSAGGSRTQLNGNEGIVTEPEDHADQESCNASNPDVTISFVDGEGSDVDPAEDVSDSDRPRTSEPLIEFPTDSPGKTLASPLFDDSDIDDDLETDSVMNENLPESDDPMIDVLNTSTESGYKILQHKSKPTHRITSNQTVVKESEYMGNATRQQSSTERESEYSFGRSLRTLSGRRSLKHINDDHSDRDKSGTSTETSYTKFFSFGKRKGEDLPSKQEPEPKRAKAEEGVDSLGFFARLTSPVINRLRGIKVGSPAMPTTSVAGEEVEGKEEMAVALFTAQPASKRCIIM